MTKVEKQILPPPMLNGDIWALQNPEEHRANVLATDEKVKVAEMKLANGESVSFDELDSRPTRDILNDEEKDMRRRMGWE